MAKEELFRIPLLATLLKRLDAFPVRRGGIGIGAIRHAIRLLKSGKTVGIFPEGTRSRNGCLLPYKPGVGFIAIKANLVPVVPIAIYAEQGKWLRQFHIVVGEPIMPDHADFRRLAQHVMQTIETLRSNLELHLASCAVGQESME